VAGDFDAQKLLEHCPSQCERSCESCLRHYRNQHLKERLDRRVAAQLLRYARFGAIPAEESAQKQAADLAALQRLLELDGYRCTEEAGPIPVLIEKAGNALPSELSRACSTKRGKATPREIPATGDQVIA